MDEKDMRKYAQLMEELGISGIELDSSGNVIRLEKPTAGKMPDRSVALTLDDTSEEDANLERPVGTDNSIREICSPLVGVFYSSTEADKPPLVSVGTRVKKGDVLCIIEAMKLMNEIVSEEDGVITEICVETNQIVDFGCVLFRLKEA